LDTHGINRLKPVYYDRVLGGKQKPVTELELIREGPTTAVFDANNGMGMIAAYRSMETAISKAKEYGMGMVVVRNSTHYGIAGYYAEMASKQGVLGITGTNARPSVAPTFGVEPMLGTNPLTFSFPTDEDFPFTLDCATSIIQRGKVEVAARNHKQLPPGVVTDANGESLINPRETLDALLSGDAALLPLGGAGEGTGGYKGYGYATVELEEFKHTTGSILRELRSARRMPGEPRIYTAGEKEYLTSLERGEKGVPVTPSVQTELIAIRNEQDLDYRFSFE
jgi:LDH2 family malate/lactate/ureidoglycolate dehydrogenase